MHTWRFQSLEASPTIVKKENIIIKDYNSKQMGTFFKDTFETLFEKCTSF
jgi:hypothetical protein